MHWKVTELKKTHQSSHITELNLNTLKGKDKIYHSTARPDAKEESDSAGFTGQTSPTLDPLNESCWPYGHGKPYALQQYWTHHLFICDQLVQRQYIFHTLGFLKQLGMHHGHFPRICVLVKWLPQQSGLGEDLAKCTCRLYNCFT